MEKEYRVLDFVNLTGVRIFKIELRPDYQASEEIFRMDKWYEADICDYQNLIRSHAVNYEFDLDKNYLIMEHTDSRHLIRGSMTKISIWNLARPPDSCSSVEFADRKKNIEEGKPFWESWTKIIGHGKPDFEYDKDWDEEDYDRGPWAWELIHDFRGCRGPQNHSYVWNHGIITGPAWGDFPTKYFAFSDKELNNLAPVYRPVLHEK
jgi:hypothetical protein